MARITNVTISIDTRNAAFRDDLDDDLDGLADSAVLSEVDRIVGKALLSPQGLYHDQPLLDYNGNTVGKVTVTREGE